MKSPYSYNSVVVTDAILYLRRKIFFNYEQTYYPSSNGIYLWVMQC